jgi:hypothetical protein
MHHHTRRAAHDAELQRQLNEASARNTAFNSEDFWLELNPASPLDEPEILPPIRPMPAPEERVDHEQWDDVPPMDR